MLLGLAVQIPVGETGVKRDVLARTFCCWEMMLASDSMREARIEGLELLCVVALKVGDTVMVVVIVSLSKSESETVSLVPGLAMSICKFFNARGRGLGDSWCLGVSVAAVVVEEVVVGLATAGTLAAAAVSSPTASLGVKPGLASIQLTMQR